MRFFQTVRSGSLVNCPQSRRPGEFLRLLRIGLILSGARSWLRDSLRFNFNLLRPWTATSRLSSVLFQGRAAMNHSFRRLNPPPGTEGSFCGFSQDYPCSRLLALKHSYPLIKVQFFSLFTDRRSYYVFIVLLSSSSIEFPCTIETSH